MDRRRIAAGVSGRIRSPRRVGRCFLACAAPAAADRNRDAERGVQCSCRERSAPLSVHQRPSTPQYGISQNPVGHGSGGGGGGGSSPGGGGGGGGGGAKLQFSAAHVGHVISSPEELRQLGCPLSVEQLTGTTCGPQVPQPPH